MNISTAFKAIGPLLKRNGPVILTGLGVAGSVTAIFLAVRATPRALNKLDVAYIDKNNRLMTEDPNQTYPEVPLTPVEVIKVVWKDYLPALGVEVFTLVSIVGAQGINMRRQAAIISAFTLSEAAFREYQDRMVIEAPTKDRKVRDDVARERITANPPSGQEIVIIEGGDQLFYEAHTDRYFQSTMQKVRKAVNDLNYKIINDNYASLNDFYNMIGLNTLPQGEETGWTTDRPLEVDYSTQMTDDDRSSIVLTYYRTPGPNYWKGHQ